MDDNKKKIINILIIICVCVVVILGIYAVINLYDKKKNAYKYEIIDYLTKENLDVKYGLLSYNFTSVSTINTSALINTHFMEKSLLNNEGINNIYLSKYGVTKENYINASNYVSNPMQNCYYYQNTLNNASYNCDSVCSMSTSQIMNEIKNKLGWDNILPEDAKTYCIKKPVYLLEGNGYFVNLNELKNLYTTITNKELTFDNVITSNEYYKYGTYLSKNISTLVNYIKSIETIDELSINSNTYKASYTAIDNKDNEIKGIVTLEKINDKYFIVANEINLGYNF